MLGKIRKLFDAVFQILADLFLLNLQLNLRVVARRAYQYFTQFLTGITG